MPLELPTCLTIALPGALQARLRCRTVLLLGRCKVRKNAICQCPSLQLESSTQQVQASQWKSRGPEMGTARPRTYRWLLGQVVLKLAAQTTQLPNPISLAATPNKSGGRRRYGRHSAGARGARPGERSEPNWNR